MGLFSSKTKHIVSTTRMNCVDEVEDATKKTIIGAVLEHTSIARALTESRINGVSRHVNKYYRLGDRVTEGKRFYKPGLPTSSMGYVYTNATTMYPYMALEGISTLSLKNPVISAELGDTDPFAYNYLLETYGWDYGSGTFETLPEGLRKGGVFTHADSDRDGFIDLFYSGGLKETITEPEFYLKDLYYTVAYSLRDDPVRYRWWYRVGSGKYPALDELNISSESSPYYPIIALRTSNRDDTYENDRTKNSDIDHPDYDPEHEPSLPEIYHSSKKMFKTLGLDFDDFGRVINENPNIGGVDHVNFGLNIDVRNESVACITYLADYFTTLKQTSAYHKDSFDAWNNPFSNTPPPTNTVEIKEDRYRYKLAYTYIYTTYEDIPVAKRTASSSVENYPKGYSFLTGQYHERSSITYVVEESGTRRTVKVHGLQMIDYIYRGKGTNIDLGDTEHKDDDGERDRFMVIPLHKGVFGRLKLTDQNEVCNHALWLTMYSHDKVKIKWYQRKWFKVVLIILAIIAAIMGHAEISAWLIGIGVVVTAIAAYALAIVVMVAIGYISKIAVNLLIKLVGPEIALIIVIAAVAIGVISPSNVNPELWKVIVYTASTVGADAQDAWNKYMQDQGAEWNAELKILDEETDLLQDDLDKLLQQGDYSKSDISGIMLESNSYSPLSLIGESPAAHYNRTMNVDSFHSIILNEVQIYHENNLTPNTIDETLAQFT